MPKAITAANYVPSLIRTYTPALVGMILSFLAVHFGLHADATATAGLTAVLGAVFTAAYYTLVRALELKYPSLSKLLGHPAMPQLYVNPKKIVEPPGGVRVLPPEDTL
jgi:hypothetical protein